MSANSPLNNPVYRRSIYATWEYAADVPIGESSVAQQLLDRYLEITSIDFNLGHAFELWAYYLARLYQIRERYKIDCEKYYEAERQFISVEEQLDTHGVSEPISDEYGLAIFGGRIRIQLEMESFFTAAKLLLERIAITFRHYFKLDLTTKSRRTRNQGSDHGFLSSNFKSSWHFRIASSRTLPSDLCRMMNDLNTRIILFRNDFIEHPDQIATGISSLVITHDAADGIRTMRVPSRTGDYSKVIDATDTPHVLIRPIEEYISEMIKYFDEHRKASIDWLASRLPSMPALSTGGYHG